MPLQIVIADEHPLFREALRLAVTRSLVGAHVVETDSASALFGALDRIHRADLVLLDLDLPDAQGFNVLVQIREAHPGTPVVVISGRKEAGLVTRTVAHGAAAFVPKSAAAETVIEALHAVLAGHAWVPPTFAVPGQHASSGASVDVSEFESTSLVSRLTPQQFRVVEMLCSGLPNKQIGLKLNVTEATVKAHMRAIMEKFGANNRTQVVLAARAGLTRLGLPGPGEQHASQRHREADELQRQQRFVKEEICLDRG